MSKIEPTETRMSSLQAARYLGVTEACMCKWRKAGRGPDFYKIHGRYSSSQADLDAFVESYKIKSEAVARSRDRNAKRSKRFEHSSSALAAIAPA